MKHVLLDSSPLGILSNPAQTAEVVAITVWVAQCVAAGHTLYVPEVIDYELRRELLRAGKSAGISALDGIKASLWYLPISTPAMLLAAELWSDSRRRGQPTGDPKKLDIDVILAAQALTLAAPPADVIVATSNVGHCRSSSPPSCGRTSSPNTAFSPS